MGEKFGPLSVGEDGAGIFDAKGRRVATVTLHPLPITSAQKRHWDERLLALAQLFAAAPEMADLLERAVSSLSDAGRMAGWDEPRLCEEIRALLAKVRP